MTRQANIEQIIQ